MSDLPFTTTHPASPLYRETEDERAEREALEIAAIAEPAQREIEAVADALAEFWDLADTDWDDDALSMAAECAAWLNTMPERLKDRIVWRIRQERRKSRPMQPITALGHTFRGYEP